MSEDKRSCLRNHISSFPRKLDLHSAAGGVSDTGWYLYVDVPEYDCDSWLILKLGRVEVQESSATILLQVTW
jgi:hypothetical protein